jgi:glycosyltransferase involved in cell wall biosynthesis
MIDNRRRTRRLKILYLLDALEGGERTGGTEGQFRELLQHLDRDRFEPHVALFRPTPATNIATRLTCPSRILDIGKLKHPRTAVKLLKLAGSVRRGQFDVVHIFLNDAAVAAPAFCRLGGAAVIAARRDMGFWYTPAQLQALRVSNRFVDAIVANSDAVRQNVHRREGYPLDRILVIPNGHDPARFIAPQLEGLRARLGVGSDDPIVGMVANFNPWKRHSDLLRAFALVRRRHPRAHLVLVGSGVTEHQVRDEAASLGLGGAVHFLGALADAVPVIRHFSVGVLCSESEGLSNAVIEYMACGKPSVCTAVGGNPELVSDEQNGFLIQPGDVHGIAARVTLLLDSDRLRQTMGEAAHGCAAQLTSARMARRHAGVYETLAHRSVVSVPQAPLHDRKESAHVPTARLL